jgi:hypothetical protein
MIFTIEEDEDIDYTATPITAHPTEVAITTTRNEPPGLPSPTAPEVATENESSGLLGDRVVGTLGFCGALALLSTTCCCFGRGLHRDEIAHTYDRHTLFGLCCPFR